MKEPKNGPILLFDGAMGTYLAAKYEDSVVRCELSNIQYPQRVIKAHREYIEAGAGAIKTNTFAANTFSMGTNLDDVLAVVDAGCKCAQEAAEEDTLVFASMGPILHDDQQKCDEERHALIDRFLRNGVTHFLFETFGEAPALKEAARYVKSVCPDAYVITECSVAPDLYTQSGVSAQSIIDALRDVPEIDAYGFNCTCGPLHMVRVVKSTEFYGKPVCIMPNAGYPTVVGGRTVFKSTPDYFAEQLIKIAQAGVKILGGCCGTTPEHIRAAAQALKALPALKDTSVKTGSRIRVPQRDGGQEWGTGKPIAVELDSPLDADGAFFTEAAQNLARAGADYITIADCPIGRARADSSMLAAMLKTKYGIRALPHLTCRDRNLNASKALLLGLHMQGVRNVLVVTGDPIPNNRRGEIKSVFQFNSVLYAEFIRDLNRTIFAEAPFTVMGALNVNAQNFDAELAKAKRKEEAGMSCFLTQPVYDQRAAGNITRAKRELHAPVWAGVMPVVSYKNACFINNELAGIDIPAEICERFKEADRQQAAKIAVETALDTIELVKDIADGYYIITPLKRADIVREIIKELKA
ncbi:bifunctional homocysteine S-methyltransferase/methylenetetrahydrofolate reductase [Christensenella timonensis]|uniref:bifunctional homocysteine S-methyltransferase/methylenetetrahydrofolate reductase n=1 Tax=Christensenella timonensis TaxID=1816678 RepID=UPI000AA1E434|nr:bifunctional homocysteine S-methyltransferase/methylenetetrahydrofolate reductase [Christensenella timonensis]